MPLASSGWLPGVRVTSTRAGLGQLPLSQGLLVWPQGADRKAERRQLCLEFEVKHTKDQRAKARQWFKVNAKQLSSMGKQAGSEARKWIAKNPDAAFEQAPTKKVAVNTKAFWQGQSFGAASPVRRIDPKTMLPVED